MKWNELFKNENDLIEALKKIDINKYKQRLLKGFIYIESFQKYLKKNDKLTEKQLIQLKRLASEVHKYHNWN